MQLSQLSGKDSATGGRIKSGCFLNCKHKRKQGQLMTHRCILNVEFHKRAEVMSVVEETVKADASVSMVVCVGVTEKLQCTGPACYCHGPEAQLE